MKKNKFDTWKTCRQAKNGNNMTRNSQSFLTNQTIDKHFKCENKIKQNDEKSVWKWFFLFEDNKITKKKDFKRDKENFLKFVEKKCFMLVRVIKSTFYC